MNALILAAAVANIAAVVGLYVAFKKSYDPVVNIEVHGA